MADTSSSAFQTRRYAVLVSSLLFMVIGTGSVYFLVVALKLITAEFDWPRVVPSAAYGLQYIGGGVGGIFMGWCLDKLGMGIPALIASVMIGLGTILTSYVTEPWELYFIYGVMLGFLGRAALFSPLTANITHWFPDKKSMAVGIVGSGQALSGAVWPAVFQYMFDQIGWRETAIWYGVFVFATMLPMVLILRLKPPKDAPAGKPGAPLRDQARSLAAMSPFKMQLMLSIASIGCCVAMSLPLAHIASHVSDLGFDASRGAEVLSVMLVCASLASFFGVGFLGGHFGGLKAIFIFSIAQAIFLGAFAFVDDLASVYLVAALFGLGYGGILPCYPVIVREYLPAPQVGRRTGVIILFAGSGMALGSWLGGIMFDLTGSYNAAFLIGSAFNLANLAIIALLIYETRRGAPVAAPA